MEDAADGTEDDRTPEEESIDLHRYHTNQAAGGGAAQDTLIAFARQLVDDGRTF